MNAPARSSEAALAERLARHADVARALDADAVALVPGPNFTRAFGHAFMSHERPFLAVIPAKGRPAAIVPALELQSWELTGFAGDVFAWTDQQGYMDAFRALAERLPMRRLAVEGQVMRVFVHHALKAAAPALEIIDAEREISALRIVKTADELAALQAAIDVSERALARTLETVRAGMTEAEVERALIRALFDEGADGLAFAPIVAAADNSARPHAKARPDHALRPGDALLFDFGATKDGMCADITRTVFVGHASDEARAVYETVLEANRRGIAAGGPGATPHQVDDAATTVLEASPFAERIRHKTGHGLGREVHEAPWIMRGVHEPMAPGTVYTVEPGLYAPGAFGVRIEDDVLIEADGARALTRFPKELMIVGR
ncbi:M24 family metallopeptidase [Oceanicella actignis]|uniref:M24 family metallopeptidase n=1 Tax=Oceanicella actignis TaxID=1189325 RepID=UPI0011E6534C|nr:Xaa-Pro peptidase family protein [Oceanicella actignis]TYO91189.1 Xaa-Pro aminopeptidase [Oceanicella actignis]